MFALPQQLPGPAQPACEGVEPQQDVSPRPGRLRAWTPERGDEAASIFLSRVLAQLLHCGISAWFNEKISLTWPQSRQR